MKILIITHLFLPDRGGGASIFSDLCFALASKGHQVEVLTSYPYYPEWKNKESVNLWKSRIEQIQGVEVFRYGMYIPTRPSSLLQRLVYEFSFFLSGLRHLVRTDAKDLTMVYCPLLGSVLLSLFIRGRTGGRLWLNIQDIPADAARATGISKSKIFDACAKAFQGFLFRRADIVSSISPVMVKRLSAIIGPTPEPVYLPNWLNQSMEKSILELAPSRPKQTERTLLLYAGNIGRKQGLADFCEALVASPGEFEFRIFGDGGEANRLKQWIAQKNDPRFTIGPFLSESDFVRALYDADWFLITETPAVGASFISSKLIPGIATGTPILAICDPSGPLGTEVRDHGLGAVVRWSELSKLEQLLAPSYVLSAEMQTFRQNCTARSLVYRRDAAVSLVEQMGAPARGNFTR